MIDVWLPRFAAHILVRLHGQVEGSVPAEPRVPQAVTAPDPQVSRAREPAVVEGIASRDHGQGGRALPLAPLEGLPGALQRPPLGTMQEGQGHGAAVLQGGLRDRTHDGQEAGRRGQMGAHVEAAVQGVAKAGTLRLLGGGGHRHGQDQGEGDGHRDEGGASRHGVRIRVGGTGSSRRSRDGHRSARPPVVGPGPPVPGARGAPSGRPGAPHPLSTGCRATRGASRIHRHGRRHRGGLPGGVGYRAAELPDSASPISAGSAAWPAPPVDLPASSAWDSAPGGPCGPRSRRRSRTRPGPG